MKRRWFRWFFFCLVTLLTLVVPSYAAGTDCAVSIEVEKKLTGDRPGTNETFVFILEPEGNAPMPDSDFIEIVGAGTGSFPSIVYTEPGDYHYKLWEETGSAKGYRYDKSVYDVTVQVTTDDDGLLTATVYMSKDGSDGKSAAAVFVNHYTAKTYPEFPPEEPEEPNEPGDPPKTGDERNLVFWIALCFTGLLGMIVTLLIFRRENNESKET